MSEIVERVAKAHWEARRTSRLLNLARWSELSQDSRQVEIQATRAAIEAMRDLPPDLQAIADDHDDDRCINGWQALIDAALK